ncbi:TonB family protein [Samsonia erythrinae]|uniref:Protein TonB n=1 Tax=Samsonia erythrinae TaxID=160434 RepID=A0A4R3VTE9_9GAMM|nr:TonB family protein [Samsonia erythrinae]TCV08522.1 outer membrane transport energization protein TonB [Samsonia erythrinae]
MKGENRQGVLSGGRRNDALNSHSLAYASSTIALAHDTANWRPLAFFVLSCVVHAVLVAFLLWRGSPPRTTEEMAGNAGGNVQVTTMAAPMPSAATDALPTPESPASPIPVVMPVLTPLPVHPAPVIKQPVAERKTVMEKKPPVREKKQPDKTPDRIVQRSIAQQKGEKTHDAPDAPARGEERGSPAPSLAEQSGSAAAAKAGESDSGQAARGAGKSNSQNFKALHRRVNYPSRAKALGVEGKVRVKFDITGSGTVTNVQILSETPDGVFGDDVMKDMARWRYRTEAPVENQVVSIIFKLNGRVQVND